MLLLILSARFSEANEVICLVFLRFHNAFSAFSRSSVDVILRIQPFNFSGQNLLKIGFVMFRQLFLEDKRKN